MSTSRSVRRVRWLALWLGLVPGIVLAGAADRKRARAGLLTLDDLQRMSTCQLGELFTCSELGAPFVGVARGRLVNLTDRRLPRLKVRLANSVWRGKAAAEDGYFTNRWIGGVNWIDSHWTIGPSWIDGRPAVVMEYAPGTRLFWNMHDELREVSPGLYMGPVFERFPCPKLRGYVALQLDVCVGTGSCP